MLSYMRYDPPPANANGLSLSALLSALGRKALNAALPPHCGLCHAEVDAAATLCPDCWSRVGFIVDPVCECCGVPFDRDWGPGTLCGPCIESHPSFDRARAATLYDDAVRSLILGLKHGDRHDLVALFASWMHRVGDTFWPTADLIVPVPLHWTRLWSRRFNQSALIAKAIGRLSDVPVLVDAITRTRRTPSQGGLGRKDRLRNVRNAFAVRQPALDRIQGKHIIVIDDVLTTGATVSQVADCLRKRGAAQIDVLTVARVVNNPQNNEGR